MAACGVVPVAVIVPVFPAGTHQHYRGITAVYIFGCYRRHPCCCFVAVVVFVVVLVCC